MVKRKQRLFNSRTQPLKKTRQLPPIFMRSNQDYKVTDTATTNASVNITGSPISLVANLSRGSAGLNNFLGNVITPISLQLRYSVIGAESSSLIPLGPDTYNNTRIIVFQWFSQTVPAPLDIIMNTGSAGAPFSAIQINNTSKIRVLHDKMITTYLNNFDGTTTTSTAQTGKCYIKAKRMEPMTFATNASSISENGNIFIFYISDSSVAPSPTITWYSRLTFTD